eukprot:4842451-Karenia_brevis.AAC.1
MQLKSAVNITRFADEADWFCIILSKDAAPANGKLCRFIINEVSKGDKCAGVQISCLQHQTGLCSKPVSTYLDVLNPTYCAVKQMRKGT